jgi:hypothetical protein
MKRESVGDTDGCGRVSQEKTRGGTDGLMWPSKIHHYAVGRLPHRGHQGAHLPVEGGGDG